MHRQFPLAAWITLSVALVAAGAWVRFDGPYVPSDQPLHGLLFFVAASMLTVALITWIPLLRLLPDDRAPGRSVAAVVFAPAASMAMLVALALESDSAADARHRAYLLRLAGIVADDFDRRGRMPVFLDDAVHRSGERPTHRGDANGRVLSYRRLDYETAILCAPECRVHVLINGSEITYQPWNAGEADPCRDGERTSTYWAGNAP